jgi:hypothetical protein
MSLMRCSYCDEFHEADASDAKWNVPRVNSAVTLEYVCGVCAEKYITEDGEFDPDLEDRENEAAWERQQAANLECPSCLKIFMEA